MAAKHLWPRKKYTLLTENGFKIPIFLKNSPIITIYFMVSIITLFKGIWENENRETNTQAHPHKKIAGQRTCNFFPSTVE